MNLYKKLMIIIIAELFSFNLIAQIKPFHEAERVIPPSPNAATLGKYGEIPISLNTGTPNINIPLYEIRVGYLNLPISLSYNASGNRVSDVASWVGLGWSLNAGGVITRKMNGLPDEESIYGYLDYDPPVGRYVVTDLDLYNYYIKRIDGTYDLYPDEFYFNFADYSGKIMYGINYGDELGFVEWPKQDLKIIPNDLSNIESWVIIAPDGTKYFFNAVDSETTIMSPYIYKSAWYLSRIENSNTGDFIDFYYSNPEGYSWQEPTDNISCEFFSPINDTEDCSLPNYEEPQIEIAATSSLFLNSIRTRYHSIDFQFDQNRTDVGGNLAAKYGRLNKIVVKERVTNEVIKEIDFTYSYFNEGKPNDQKRLCLDQIQESGKPPYIFEYNSNEDFPEYESANIDYYGFSNDANNGDKLWVSVPDDLSDYYNVHTVGADRSVKYKEALMGILEKITYPTGGYTSFDYENNTTEQEESFHIFENREAYVSFDNYLQDDPFQDEIRLYHGVDPGENFFIGYDNFKLNKRTLVNLESLYNGVTRIYSRYPSLSEVEGSEIVNDGNKNIYLDAGIYALVVILQGTIQQGDVAYAKLKWDTGEIGTITVYPNYSGVRIKRMIDSDGIDPSNNLVTDYIYEKDYIKTLKGETVEDKNSLKIHHTGTYHYLTICNDLIMTSYLTDDYGKPIRNEGSYYGYDEVAIVKSGVENGITIKKFENVQPFFRNTLLSTEMYNSEFNLVESNVTDYKKIVGSEYANPKIGNVYYYSGNISAYEPPTSWTTGMAQFDFTLETKSSNYYLPYKNTKTIYTTEGNIVIEKNINYDGFNNSLNFAHGLPTMEIVNTSDEREIITRNKYSFDYEYDGEYAKSIGNMYNGRVLAPVIEKEIWQKKGNDTTLLASTLTIFDDFSLLPKEIYILEEDNPLTSDEFNSSVIESDNFEYSDKYKKPKRVYQYDNYGNPSKILTNAEINTYYVWAYDAAYPVIKIESSNDAIPVEQIQTAVNVLSLSGGEVKSEIDTDIANLKTAVSSYTGDTDMVTYYTYKPLIGITSETNPREQTVYYTYDSFGHLEKVLDQDYNIIKEHEYNYGSQSQ